MTLRATERATGAILYNGQKRTDTRALRRKLHSGGYPGVIGMEKFVHEQNLAHYRTMLSEKTHEQHRPQILKMLAEEIAKDLPPTDGVDRNPPFRFML